MDALAYSLNAVLPLVLMCVAGYVFKRIGILSAEWGTIANKFNFRCLIPLQLFMNIYTAESIDDVDWNLAIFAFSSLVIVFILSWVVIRRIKEDKQKGVVWQAIFRSNFSLLGLPLALALYGSEAGQAMAFLSIISIPMFNIMSVAAMQAYGPRKKTNLLKQIAIFLKSIITNPLIIGILAGIVSLLIRAKFVETGTTFRFSDVKFLYSGVSSLSQAASPLALVALGSQFDFKAAKGMLAQISIGTLGRLVFVPGLALTAAYLFTEFRNAEFAALLALFGSPMAVSASVMAAEMGGDATLAGQLLFWTTCLSSVTIFLFVFVFRTIGAL